jgi:hypothetical protein
MNTRSNEGPLLPETDPNLIIRKANAERRKAKLLASIEARAAKIKEASVARTLKKASHQLSSPLESPTTGHHLHPSTSDPATSPGMSGIQETMSTPTDSHKKESEALGKTKATSSSTASPGVKTEAKEPLTVDNVPLDQFMRFVMKAQVNAEADRAAAAKRFEVLEQAFLKLSANTGQSTQTTSARPGRIDLQRFKTSDGPIFKGPFRDVEPFVRWVHGIQIFFSSKDISHSDDRIRVVGGLIEETNMLAFYANEAEKFIGRPWSDFKDRMFTFALPPQWRTDLKKQIQQLAMKGSETFVEYSTRARTLQSMHNFDKPTISDFELAQFVTFGTSDALQGKISDFELLERTPFDYSLFEKKASGYHNTLISPSHGHSPRVTKTEIPDKPPNTTGHLNREEFIWRIHAYLDSQGLCHFCKKTCGSAPGTCPGPLDRSIIPIPPAFVAPPKPFDYKRPHPRGQAPSTAGKPTHPPAGRPSHTTAAVSALTEEEMYSALDEAAVSAIQVMDDELELAKTEKALNKTLGEQTRVSSVSKASSNFFPELDQAAVAALADLDEHLATLNRSGYVPLLKSTRTESNLPRIKTHPYGQCPTGRVNHWSRRAPTWRTNLRYLNHQISRPPTPNPKFPAPRPLQSVEAHKIELPKKGDYQLAQDEVMITGPQVQFPPYSPLKTSSYFIPLLQSCPAKLLQCCGVLSKGELSSLFIPPLSTSNLSSFPVFYRRGDCETPLVLRVSQGQEDQIT